MTQPRIAFEDILSIPIIHLNNALIDERRVQFRDPASSASSCVCRFWKGMNLVRTGHLLGIKQNTKVVSLHVFGESSSGDSSSGLAFLYPYGR